MDVFLKKAEKDGLLKKSYVGPDPKNPNLRKSVYIMLTEQMPQRTKFKKFIEKFLKYFKT